MHKNTEKVAFTITAVKDYNPGWNNHSTPVQQPRFTMFGSIKRVPESKVGVADVCAVICYAKEVYT